MSETCEFKQIIDIFFSGAETNIGPVGHRVFLPVEVGLGRVEFSSPLDSVHLRTLFINSSFCLRCGLNHLPPMIWVGGLRSEHKLDIIRGCLIYLLILRREKMLISSLKSIEGRGRIPEITLSPFNDARLRPLFTQHVRAVRVTEELILLRIFHDIFPAGVGPSARNQFHFLIIEHAI